MKNNEKEIILITGASRGIGAEIGRYLCSKKRIIYVNYLKNKESANNVAQEIKEKGGEAFPVKGDVSLLGDVINMFKVIDNRHSRLDVLINNATPALRQEKILDLSWEDFQKQLDIMVKGAFYCSTEAVRIMKRKKKGHIINILSSYLLGTPPSHLSHYITAKYALMGLSQTLGVEARRFGIRVNMVSPYTTRTDLISFMSQRHMEIVEGQQGRFLEPKDTAKTVSFLVSEEASSVNLTNTPVMRTN